MTPARLTLLLSVLLFLSLSGNFFLLGKMAGTAAREEQTTAAPPADSRRAEWAKREQAVREALSDTDQKILKTEMERHKPQIEAVREELDNARRAVEQALNAAPFDQAALDAAVAEEQKHKLQLLQLMKRVRDETLSNLSPEGQETMQKMGPLRRGGWMRGEGGERRTLRRPRAENPESVPGQYPAP